MMIVTEDGETIETHQIIFSLFSRSLDNIFGDYPQSFGVPVISVPIDGVAVRNLIRILSVGTVYAKEEHELLDVS